MNALNVYIGITYSQILRINSRQLYVIILLSHYLLFFNALSNIMINNVFYYVNINISLNDQVLFFLVIMGVTKILMSYFLAIKP